MALESATYISDLVSTNPTSSDNLSQGDDHLRLLKSTIKATFPNVSGAVTATHTELNVLDGLTASQAELNFVDGVTSSIQTQLNAKAPLASPTLTGVPSAPTAAVDTNTTQLATTAYVVNQGYLKSSTASSTYLTSATAASTYQTALGFAPIQQGGGTDQLSNKMYIGWSASSQLRVQVDSTDFGVTWPINISGTAAAPSSAAVLGATAAAAVGEVGTYAFLRSIASTAYNPGATVAGSLLSYTNANGGGGGASPAGSWRLMGLTGTASNSALTSVWLRYA